MGQLLAERLAAAGVRHAFAFPGGGSNLELLEALNDAGVEGVLTHTETGAAFMACATADITGAPGVVIVGNGPGAASVVNGVAHAFLDRVPLVVVTDRYADADVASTGHQVLDQRGLLGPVVKYGATLDALHAREIIDTAIDSALALPLGPVHLDVPRDVLAEAIPAAAPRVRAVPPARRHAAPLDALAAALHAAERPAVLVGLEANRSVDPRHLREVVDRLGAAVMTTYKAKGVYPEDDPRWAGTLTGGEIERPLLERAGALLTVGLDPVELLTRPWSYEAPVMSLAETDAPHRYLRPRHGATGPLGELVEDLARRLGARPAAGWPAGEITAARESMLESLRLDGGEPLPGWRVVERVTVELPPETTITVDAGAHMFPATCFGRPRGPRRFLISSGLATMGFAVPAAIGAALARPGDPVVAFVGDGGMAYHVSELETAARCGARIIVVVFNDSSLSLIRIKQEAKGYVRRPLDFGLTRFDALAEGLGVRGVRVETANELSAAVQGALAAPESTVIDVRVTGREYRATVELIRGA